MAAPVPADSASLMAAAVVRPTMQASTGTIPAALSLINAQLGEFQVAAKVVVVRVTEGDTVEETIANIVGDGLTTGLEAFIQAGSILGVIPRLLSAPGFTSQRSGSNANGVCAALPSICNRLLAHAVVDGPATTEQAAIDWRETLSSTRLIPVDPAVRVMSGANVAVVPLSPAVIGIGVRRDHEKQGRPFHSWANQPVQSIVGPSRPINFSLTDGATEGQRLLSHNLGVLLRGEMGVETAISSGGFVFVGTDNAGEDDLWRFYNVTRGRDYIHLMFLRTLRFYLGRFNITGQTVQAVLNTIGFALRDLKADGDILGYPKATPLAYRLFELLPMMPRFTIERVRKELNTTFPTATAAVKILEDLGILCELTGNKKNRHYSYQGYVDLLSR